MKKKIEQKPRVKHISLVVDEEGYELIGFEGDN